jgi:hypothetical protein
MKTRRGGARGSIFRRLLGLRETIKQTPKGKEYETGLEKQRKTSEKSLLEKLKKARKEEPSVVKAEKSFPNPQKTAAEYRKELSAFYDRQGEKKPSPKEKLYMGKAPEGEGEEIPRKTGKTPLEKKLDERLSKLPPEPPLKASTLSKLRGRTGLRTSVAGKRRSRRRKLH